MDHSSKHRYTIEGDEAKKQAIVATDEWFEELNNLPFKSCKITFLLKLILIYNIEKNGKTLYLLKQTAKTSKAKKQRKIVPLLGSI